MSVTIAKQDRTIDHLLRTPALYWGGLAMLLLTAQLMCGVGIAYALLICLFIILAYFTVYALGGPATLLGFFVTYLTMQHVIVYNVAKALLWQQADTPLLRPVETAGAYVVGMTSMLAAALIARRLDTRRWKPLFAPVVDPHRLFWMAVVCIVLSAARYILAAKHSDIIGVNTLVFLPPLSVVSATAYTILSSEGRKSVSALNITAILVMFTFGAIGAERTNMVLGPIMYYLTCYMFGFKFRPIHFGALLTGIYVTHFILFPYGSYARTVVRTPSFEKNVRLATELFIDVVFNPLKYQQQHEENAPDDAKRYRFFTEHTSTLDRFSIILSADGIVNATLEHGTTGMDTIEPGFEILLPRYLNPYKPNITASNMLAHRSPGLVGKNDFVTQITLGSYADAFSSYGWAGITIIPFWELIGVWVGFRTLFDLKLRYNAIPLSLAFAIGSMFSEGPIAVLISIIMQGFIVLLAASTAIRALVNVLQSFGVPGLERVGVELPGRPLAPGREAA